MDNEIFVCVNLTPDFSFDNWAFCYSHLRLIINKSRRQICVHLDYNDAFGELFRYKPLICTSNATAELGPMEGHKNKFSIFRQILKASRTICYCSTIRMGYGYGVPV